MRKGAKPPFSQAPEKNEESSSEKETWEDRSVLCTGIGTICTRTIVRLNGSFNLRSSTLHSLTLYLARTLQNTCRMRKCHYQTRHVNSREKFQAQKKLHNPNWPRWVILCKRQKLFRSPLHQSCAPPERAGNQGKEPAFGSSFHDSPTVGRNKGLIGIINQ